MLEILRCHEFNVKLGVSGGAGCNTGKHSDNLEGIASTSAIETLLAQAKSIITRLDAGGQNRYLRDPDKLAVRKSASRTERTAKKAVAPATPPPAA